MLKSCKVHCVCYEYVGDINMLLSQTFRVSQNEYFFSADSSFYVSCVCEMLHKGDWFSECVYLLGHSCVLNAKNDLH